MGGRGDSEDPGYFFGLDVDRGGMEIERERQRERERERARN